MAGTVSLRSMWSGQTSPICAASWSSWVPLSESDPFGALATDYVNKKRTSSFDGVRTLLAVPALPRSRAGSGESKEIVMKKRDAAKPRVRVLMEQVYDIVYTLNSVKRYHFGFVNF